MCHLHNALILKILFNFIYRVMNITEMFNRQLALKTATFILLLSTTVLKSQNSVESIFSPFTYNSRDTLALSSNEDKFDKRIFFGREWSANLLFYPQFKFKNAVLNKMYKVQANINPTLHLNLWKGASLTSQFIIPVYNDFSDDESRVRPSFLTLSQRFLLPGDFRFLATVGNFNMQRAGVDLKAFKKVTSKLGIYGQVGLTGWSLAFLDNWYFSDLNKVNWRVGANYFIESKNVILNFNVSKYLEDDIAARAEIIRYFKNASIGFYVQTLQYQDYSVNGGFFFTISLPPRNRGSRGGKRVSVSTSEHFSLEYVARPYEKRGVLYKTAPNDNSSFNFFNRSLLHIY